MYSDICYNKCTILFTNVKFIMNNVLICQLIGLSVTTKPMSAYGAGTQIYVTMQNKKKQK